MVWREMRACSQIFALFACLRPADGAGASRTARRQTTWFLLIHSFRSFPFKALSPGFRSFLRARWREAPSERPVEPARQVRLRLSLGRFGWVRPPKPHGRFENVSAVRRRPFRKRLERPRRRSGYSAGDIAGVLACVESAELAEFGRVAVALGRNRGHARGSYRSDAIAGAGRDVPGDSGLMIVSKAPERIWLIVTVAATTPAQCRRRSRSGPL